MLLTCARVAPTLRFVERGSGAPDRVEQLVGAALNELLLLPDVRRVGFALSEGGGRRLRFTASDRDNGGGVDWCHIDAYDDVPLTTVFASGDPVVSSLTELQGRYAGFVEQQRRQKTAAVAAYPLTGSASPLGAIILYYAADQTFDVGQRRDLGTLAARLAVELRAAQAVTGRQVRSLADEPVPDGSLATVLTVSGEPSGVSSLRHDVSETLQAWGLDDDAVDDAVLCLSELVTNAVIHTRSGCEVRLVLDRGLLAVTVRDQGAPPSAIAGGDLSLRDPLQVHGRGLQLVDALSSRWGSVLDASGSTVWFLLETRAHATQG